MKKLFTLTISLLLIINLAKAQAPQGFKYQASIRDNNGVALLNKLVAIKISLLAGTSNGTIVYSEIHNVVTTDFGIINLNIGSGIVGFGNFNSIDWGSNTYFIKTEVDVNNGTNFLFIGTSQLLSVPYAMFAAKSGNAANDKDQDSTNELQSLTLNNNNLQLNKNGGSVDLTKYDKDSQQLVLTGNTLSITKGNSIVLSGAVDLDADPTNEIQNLSLSKDTLKLSKANFVVLPKDNDADSTNEIQSLSIANDSLQLSKSNKVAFPKNLDNDSLNEIQQIQQTGNSLVLTKNGGTVSVPSLSNIQNGSILYATASGINSIILTLSTVPSSYITGMNISFKAASNNTGHVTINLNNLGIKPLFKNVSDTLKPGEIKAGKVYNIIYDGTRFQVLNQLNNYYFSSGITNKNDTISNDFKITDYSFPGKVDRIVFIPRQTNFNFVVPSDSIVIISGNYTLLTACGYSCIPADVNVRSTIVVGQGDTVSVGNYYSAITLIVSKAYVTPVMIPPGTNYIVPAGKKLCLLKGSSAGVSGGCWIQINSSVNSIYATAVDYNTNTNSSFYPSGTSIYLTCGFLNGYLFD